MTLPISHKHETKENSESPIGIEPSVRRSDAPITELRRTRGELGHMQDSCMS